jgi:hypothetical protein
MGEEKKKDKFAELEQMSVDELKVMKTEIKNLLSNLEDQYRKAEVTEKSYTDVKRKNKAKLAKVTEILYNMGITDESEPPAAGTAPATAAATPPAAAPAPATPTPSTPPAPAATAPAAAKPAAEEKPKEKPAEKAPTQAAAAAPAAAPMPGIGGVSEAKFAAEMEKLKLLLDATKASATSTDEKIMRMTESIGELRSLVYQREGIAKEQDVELQKLKEQVVELKPEQMAKEFAKRDKYIGTHDMKIEKLEFKSKDLIKNLGDIRALLKSIGGLENIAEVNKAISKKGELLSERAKKIDRLSAKIEEIFVDLNKKMEDFFLYKAKQETLDEMVQEIMRSTDSFSVQMKEYVNKKDLEALKEGVTSVGTRLREMKKLIDMIIPIMKLKIPESLQELQKEKEDIENLMESMEESYKKGKISQKEYRDLKKRNQDKLAGLKKSLQDEWSKFESREKIGEMPPAVEKQVQKIEKIAEPQKVVQAPPAAAPAAEAEGSQKLSKAEESQKTTQEGEIEGSQKLSKAEETSKPVVEKVDASKTAAQAPAQAAPPAPVGKKEEKPAPKAEKAAPAPAAAAVEATAAGDVTEQYEKEVRPAEATATEGKAPKGEKKEKENVPEAAAAGKKGEEKPAEEAKPKAKGEGDTNTMLSDLQDSLDSGLITKETFEKAKKMLEKGG